MGTKDSDGNNEVKAVAGPQRDSTTTVPMFSLEDAIRIVEKIRDKALETALMPDVAKKLGYANATSTPFYRRIVAARLFGLLSDKSSLTQRATDYFRPHDEEMKSRVLADAVSGIPTYVELVRIYSGKKLNVELAANAIAKERNLTDSCALVCARAFEASIQFAGMLSADGIVQVARSASPQKQQGDSAAEQETISHGADGANPDGGVDTQQHTLYLDRGKARRFTILAPLAVKRVEYERIVKWLEFTLIIEDDKETGA